METDPVEHPPAHSPPLQSRQHPLVPEKARPLENSGVTVHSAHRAPLAPALQRPLPSRISMTGHPAISAVSIGWRCRAAETSSSRHHSRPARSRRGQVRRSQLLERDGKRTRLALTPSAVRAVTTSTVGPGEPIPRLLGQSSSATTSNPPGPPRIASTIEVNVSSDSTHRTRSPPRLSVETIEVSDGPYVTTDRWGYSRPPTISGPRSTCSPLPAQSAYSSSLIAEPPTKE